MPLLLVKITTINFDTVMLMFHQVETSITSSSVYFTVNLKLVLGSKRRCVNVISELGTTASNHAEIICKFVLQPCLRNNRGITMPF